MPLATTNVIDLAVSPRGGLYLDERGEPPGAGALGRGVAARIRRAFGEGAAHGLLHLASAELATELPPSLAYGRRIAKAFLAALCARARDEPAMPVPLAAATLDGLVGGAPPMRGGEYVSGDLVRRVWAAMEGVVAAELAEFSGTLHEYVQRRNPAWNALGRVTFHLAERKDNALLPFAFLATYAADMQESGRLQHVPLGKAIEAHRGDREGLLRLLRPVDAASRASPLIGELVESGRIHHPLAWSAEEAHAFLKAVPACERSGIAVRVPDWWKGGRPARVTATAVVGASQAKGIGIEALLDFDVALSLDGRRLTAKEREELLRGRGGLRLIKGQWVEVDADRLRDALAQLEAVASGRAGEGLSFARAMRLLAGAPAGEGAAGAEEGGDDPAEWTRVEAGPWLGKLLEDLRHPEGSREASPGRLLRGSLRPYQKAGVSWLWLLGRLGLGACLADDMGLGKTVQVISLLLLLRKHRISGPDLLVVPASLLGNWRAEVERFAPSLSLKIAHRSELAAGALRELAADGIEDADVVMTTYATLARLEPLQTRAWGLVVLDEAQAIKNPGTRQAKTVKRLASRQRVALTGTPIENRLGDVWSLFDFLCPGLLGGARQFGAFTKQLARAGSGYAPLRRLLRPYILRRLKTDSEVAPDLPDKTELNVYCGLTRVQAALYSESVGELARKLKEAEGIERRGVVLTFLMRLKQICNHPSQWLGDGAFAAGDSGKFGRLTELCEPIASRQEKLLLFTQFREMTRPLADHLATIFGARGLVLHGQTPVRRRPEMVEEFQSDAGPPFFVLSLKAGGTGLNLTAASHVIHFDRWWNPAVENQATDRAFRIGQKRNVMVHKFVCRGTVEERVDEMIASKQKLAREVIASGGEAALTELSTDELMEVVALDLDRAASD